MQRPKTLPPVFTFIRVIRQPEGHNISTYTGLRGWITHRYPDEQACCVQLVRDVDRYKVDATSTSVKLGDFVTIKSTAVLR